MKIVSAILVGMVSISTSLMSSSATSAQTEEWSSATTTPSTTSPIKPIIPLLSLRPPTSQPEQWISQLNNHTERVRADLKNLTTQEEKLNYALTAVLAMRDASIDLIAAAHALQSGNSDNKRTLLAKAQQAHGKAQQQWDLLNIVILGELDGLLSNKNMQHLFNLCDEEKATLNDANKIYRAAEEENFDLLF